MLSSNERIEVQKARDFAIKAHWGQMYGAEPYIAHLEEVASICAAYNLPVYVQVAAYLHDVVEDTNVHADQICSTFGYEVATLVYAVTDIKTELTMEKAGALLYGDKPLSDSMKEEVKRFIRQDKKRKTYPKILSHPHGVHLKLADRIANLRACAISKDQKMFDRYCNEAQEFAHRLKTPGVAEDMWAALEKCYGNKAVKEKIL